MGVTKKYVKTPVPAQGDLRTYINNELAKIQVAVNNILILVGDTPLEALIQPALQQVEYTLVGSSFAGPGIRARWDGATVNRYMDFGLFDNLAVWRSTFVVNGNGGLTINPTGVAAGSFMSPAAEQTLYSLLGPPIIAGAAKNGPGIQARWDGGTVNRYLAFGTYDGTGAWTELLRYQNGVINFSGVAHAAAASTGAASALPANPAGYMSAQVAGVDVKFPYYLP